MSRGSGVQGAPGVQVRPVLPGAQGPQGPEGPQGPAGVANTVFARVGGDGTVGQQRGVVSITGLDGGPRPTGVYQVNFDRDVTKCVPTISRADVELPRDANFSVRQPEPNAMLVTVYNDAGTALTLRSTSS